MAMHGESTATDTELHVCCACSSRLVHLVGGAEGSPGIWELTLRCPECLELRDVRCTEILLARLEEELYRGAVAIHRELERLERLRFEEDMECFLTALWAGAILPMDLGVAQ
jgi:hypothetical protein